jgi:hypothetical protein
MERKHNSDIADKREPIRHNRQVKQRDLVYPKQQRTNNKEMISLDPFPFALEPPMENKKQETKRNKILRKASLQMHLSLKYQIPKTPCILFPLVSSHALIHTLSNSLPQFGPLSQSQG